MTTAWRALSCVSFFDVCVYVSLWMNTHSDSSGCTPRSDDQLPSSNLIAADGKCYTRTRFDLLGSRPDALLGQADCKPIVDRASLRAP